MFSLLRGTSKCHFFFLITIQTILSLSLIICLAYDNWFYQDWISKDFDYKFKGNLNHPKSDLTITCTYSSCIKTNKIYNETYIKTLNSEIFTIDCTKDDTFFDCKNKCSGDCDMLGIWGDSALIIISTYVPSLILGFINTAFLLVIYFIPPFISCFKCSMLMSIGMVIIETFLQIIGFIIWAAEIKLHFSDCSFNIPYSGSKNICGTTSAVLSVCFTIYFPLLTYGYWVIALKARRGYNRITPENIEKASRVSDINEIDSMKYFEQPMIVVNISEDSMRSSGISRFNMIARKSTEYYTPNETLEQTVHDRASCTWVDPKGQLSIKRTSINYEEDKIN
ncbi:hypothetical protein SteCoe_16131 [Stentor coeruleus]|uniref:Uncharacterized protein n=1 Tax=Stentor coeruleus TaxID=5963 RepID=A0A1R2C1Y8_9CILI|nr:hypothetical protein SteCoe_16131 [Stentor coeruleus]